jgi:nitric oxide synthase-interacting protein
MITPEGYLYDKESVLEYIITKKNEVSRRLKEYEKEKKREVEELASAAHEDQLKQIESFKKQENDITVKGYQPKKAIAAPSISNVAPGMEGHVPSFWIPSKTPEAKKSSIPKPDKTVYCPMSGNALKMKDLIPVKFTEIKDNGDKKSLIAKDARYCCPVTRDTLSNSIQCAVIRTSGDVVTMDCVEKIIKKDWLHPMTGEKLTEKDIIPLQRGGTGFSGTNINLQAEEKRPSIQV